MPNNILRTCTLIISVTTNRILTLWLLALLHRRQWYHILNYFKKQSQLRTIWVFILTSEWAWWYERLTNSFIFVTMPMTDGHHGAWNLMNDSIWVLCIWVSRNVIRRVTSWCSWMHGFDSEANNTMKRWKN